MPNFRLSEKEADDLSAFLLSKSKREVASRGPAGRVKQGEELFGSLGCRQCHVTKPDEAVRTPFFLLTDEPQRRGCLADRPSTAKATKSNAAIPDFLLDGQQRMQIERAWPSLRFQSAAEGSKRLMKAMHCQACHDRDGVKSTRMQVIVEESESGFPPEQLPALTWTGERLRQDWMESFIAGKVEKKPREWLKARMPAFPAYAQAIAAGIVAEHGLDGSPPPQTPVNDELAAAGKDLIAAGGLDCRQCHGLGDAKPTGDKQTLLAPGINFSMVKDRIQPEFYHRWMLDPPRYDTNTRMPKLAPDGKKTKVTKFFDGDAQKQFDAIWEYLKQP
jgi:mono/diheme cytochrome c family protein